MKPDDDMLPMLGLPCLHDSHSRADDPPWPLVIAVMNNERIVSVKFAQNDEIINSMSIGEREWCCFGLNEEIEG